jgi:Skp family chaperone for outer membrane proteins
MTARTRWSVAALLLVALTLGACTSKDAKASDVRKALEDAGATHKQATCVANNLDDELDQKQMNDVAKADNLSDLSKSLQDTVNEVLNQCLVEEGSSESTDTTATTTEGESTESTTTTVG